MRLTLEFVFNEKLCLPIQYNNIVQGFIYTNLSNSIFRDFLHENGYKYEKRKFKLFTYSRLDGNFSMSHNKSMIYFTSPIKLVISSSIDEFINDLGSTIMTKENLHLGKNIVRVKSVDVSGYKNQKNEVQIRMLSPMVTYSTVEVHGMKKTFYHKPGDLAFSKLLMENLLKKYQIIYGKKALNGDLDIKIIKNAKEIIMKYKNIVIKGWSGDYVLKGDVDLIKIAYETGLGSKNSQGFGCFEIID